MSESLAGAGVGAVGSSTESLRLQLERSPRLEALLLVEEATARREELATDHVNEVSSVEEEEEHDDAVPPWIRVSFPSIKTERGVAELLGGDCAAPCSAEAWALCDECAGRRVAVCCSECALALCWRCADAIHIIPELAGHHVRLVATTESIAAIQSAASNQDVELLPSPISVTPEPTTSQADHHASTLDAGCGVLFRAMDCGCWPRELLHGVVVSSSETTATTADGVQRAFNRVLWLRGVESLADGSFRANLVLPAPHDRASSIAPTLSIGVFPTRLGALRAVATAEALARRSRRHARAAAAINKSSSVTQAVTSAEVAQIRREALDALNRLALDCPLRPIHDTQFLDEVSSGRWGLDKWLAGAIGQDLAREWLDEGLEHLDGPEDGAEDAHWPPPKQQLVRFFSLEARALSLPAHERSRQLLRVVNRLLFVSMGFSWTRWRKFVRRHRRHERQELEMLSASKIQRWTRRRWERSRKAASPSSLMNMARSMNELEQLYRRRQAAARALFELLMAQWEKRMRRAVERWATSAELQTPDVQRRIARVQHSTKWHPSHGMGSTIAKGSKEGDLSSSALLPSRLPRAFAHATRDGRVVVEDAARFQQFRATHAGPTASSYWLLRGRVLLGAYPSASSPAPGKLSKRVGAISSVAGGDQRPVRPGKDPITNVLLEQVDTFVCLMTTRELKELEDQLERTEVPTKDDKLLQTKTQATTTPWRFERIVRRRYAALLLELRAGENRASRQLELALKAQADAAEAVTTRQASRRSSAQDVADAEQELEMAAARCELARQHDATARAGVSRLTMRLEFAHLPIDKDGGPEDGRESSEAEVHRALELVTDLEARLRVGRSVFAFSKDGHGRTGLVGALLVGRLYGLAAGDAIERAQRVHDCQPRYQSVSMSSPSATAAIPASPTSARLVALVRSALATSTDAIYAPLTRENPAQAFTAKRAAQRGLLGALLLDEDGALLSDEPDEKLRSEQVAELRGEQRVAVREAAAHKRAVDRRREGSERSDMMEEDQDVEDEERGEVSLMVATVIRRVEALVC